MGGLRSLARGALLLAAAVAAQSLRFFLPLPLTASAFIIGTLVHMLLALACAAVGLRAALVLALLLPVTAYFQGQLALPVLIPVVMLGNAVFCWLYLMSEALTGITSSKRARRAAQYILPPLAKTCCMTLAAWLALDIADVRQEGLRSLVLFAMSVPQLVTGAAGIWLAGRLRKLLQPFIG